MVGVIKRMVMTEKAVKLMETENTITLIVDPKATKSVIKKAVEESFNVKVSDVRTLNTVKNEKKAFIKLKPESLASDVGSKMGVI